MLIFIEKDIDTKFVFARNPEKIDWTTGVLEIDELNEND